MYIKKKQQFYQKKSLLELLNRLPYTKQLLFLNKQIKKKYKQ